MTTAAPRCRGFTHPVISLLRSTLKTYCEPSVPVVLNRPRLLQPARARLNARLFATTAALCKQPGASVTANSSQRSPSSVPAPKVQPVMTQSYVEQLAQKSSPTTLYEAAPQRGFVFSSYTATLFCMGIGGVNHWVNVYNIPDGLQWWIPYAFGVVTFCMAIPATVFALRPAAVVRSIKILPTQSTKVTSVASKARSSVSRVQLEIIARRHIPIPGLPLKRIKVEPHEVVMKSRLYNPTTTLSDYEKFQAKKEDEKRKKAERDYELNHIMTAPFRHAGWAIGTIFSGVRRGITGEGFAPIWIQGSRYKIPITDAYVLDNGRALDRIVRIEESTSVARNRTEPK